MTVDQKQAMLTTKLSSRSRQASRSLTSSESRFKPTRTWLKGFKCEIQMKGMRLLHLKKTRES